MSLIVVVAAEILAHPDIPPLAQGLLIALIGRIIVQLQGDHQLTAALMEQAREYEIPTAAYPGSAFVPQSEEADFVIEVGDETVTHAAVADPLSDPVADPMLVPVPVAAVDEDEEGED
jgi:hypothetical protein